MQLNIKDGKLSWGSVYKLGLVGSATIWLAFVAVVYALILITIFIGLATRDDFSGVNAAAVMPALIAYPIFFLILSLISAAFSTAGVWIYSRFRPIKVRMDEDIARQFD